MISATQTPKMPSPLSSLKSLQSLAGAREAAATTSRTVFFRKRGRA
jgi:hypothetical protein